MATIFEIFKWVFFLLSTVVWITLLKTWERYQNLWNILFPWYIIFTWIMIWYIIAKMRIIKKDIDNEDIEKKIYIKSFIIWIFIWIFLSVLYILFK